MSTTPPKNDKKRKNVDAKPAATSAATDAPKTTYMETRNRKKAREALDLISGQKQRQTSLFNLLGKEYTGPTEDQLKMIFRMFDTNRDGKIGPEELAGVLRMMGKRPLTKRIDKILNECDKDRKGYIEMDEFIEYMQNKAMEKAKMLGLIPVQPENNGTDGDAGAGDTDEEDNTKKSPAKKTAKKAAAKKAATTSTTSTATTTTATKAVTKQPSFFQPLTKGSSIVHFYNANAGTHSIANAPVDKFNNPMGVEYDLGVEGAFTSFTILVGSFYKMELKCEKDLKAKGFTIQVVDTEKEFIEKLPSADIAYIISGLNENSPTKNEFIAAVKKFHQSGKGLFIWSDNDPYTVQANWILQDLFGAQHVVKGCESAQKDLTLATKAGEKQKFQSHLITSGIVTLYEGHTISWMNDVPDQLAVLALSTEGHNILMHSVDEKLPENCGRIVVDTGFTKLMDQFYSAGVERYIKNATVWLLGLDHRFKLGQDVQGEITQPREVPVWQYQHGSWLDYDIDASKLVEHEYQDWLKNPYVDVRSVKSGHWCYQVDFKQMLQTNIQHNSHTQRSVRREMRKVVAK
ncbi:hypothetical protein SAMD00019534_095950 [Acytostelium subglobosum LB1]|uniref:hypothetical protein n=1 Tax=Acytostelium subglobosum LB1 TaxID=1410327 RepID=UPI000644EB77|nr:hypothetical protein SAMD00019534_095950 [Acytostelium subglobosum LB1]GAM26420.1 hypothetical protein SAMD00019534_095950 [Acytostelium subglobosum LB1]|eukprot:XP_012750516.1 hypothetical protein SAMD00019534_095950 [Acytostelium subglobosum LB1]